jgi:alpha/beta superfamily hydrolase
MRTANPGSVRTFFLDGPAGRLEAVLNEGSRVAKFAAVLAHPHPLGGGSLHNKIVYHAMKVMNAPEWGFGFPVLRFNFRGTGRSEGQHDGTAEAADVLTALAWIENEYKLPLIGAGFSFGAAMTLAAICGRESIPVLRSEISGSGMLRNVTALVAIGLPVRSGAARESKPFYDYSFLRHCEIPKLFLSGEQDEYATKTELIEAAAAASEPKKVALVPGADHFFTGHLSGMQSALAGWLKEQVYDPGERSGI